MAATGLNDVMWQREYGAKSVGGPERAEDGRRPTVRLIATAERGGEHSTTVARSSEMADNTPKPVPDFRDVRPTRTDDAAAVDGTTVTRLLGNADPAFAPSVAAPNRTGFTASGAVAATAHVLVLLAFFAVPTSEFGSGGDSVDAISVSIISAAALESRAPSADVAARAAPDQIAPREGDSETASQAAPDKPEETVQPPKREDTEPPPVEVEQEIATAPTAPDAPAVEVVPDAQVAPAIADATPEPVVEPIPEPQVAKVEPPPDPPPPEKGEQEPKEEKPTEEASAPSPDATAAGGAPSRGVAPELPPAAAAAAASRGDANAYGLAVQAALLAADQRKAKARVAASRAKGTVVLRLVIAGDGALERADVQKSSGHRQLDEAAVQLVRLTAFPRPPAGLTADQRAYIAPIVFR
jgi:periplasmic protein TonB